MSQSPYLAREDLLDRLDRACKEAGPRRVTDERWSHQLVGHELGRDGGRRTREVDARSQRGDNPNRRRDLLLVVQV